MKKSQYNPTTGELTTFDEAGRATTHLSSLTDNQRKIFLKEKEVFEAWNEVEKAKKRASEAKQKLDASKVVQAESALAEAERKLVLKEKEFKQFCEGRRSTGERPDSTKTKQSLYKSYKAMGFSEAEAKLASDFQSQN